MEYENDIQKEQTLTEYFSSSARPTLTVDVALYQSYLEDSGLSEAQKEEFLRALWCIVVSFVELGFNVHPLQEACGQKELASTQHAPNALDCVK
jgi:hypothetical protein